GADIQVTGTSALVSGVKELHGTQVYATDLRAGAAMVIAGLAAKGITTIYNVEHIYRGYDDLVGKLAGVGALIRSE
ncbi:MAG: UDP-N-acetylglucosamine 1-carboxyvinyltransferase, partial [Clostridiales bacterium]